MKNKIENLVGSLPEVYQSIYGHPELSKNVSRECNDRLSLILKTYDLLSREVGRPLKVLDLGCAQAFFSLSLAKKGAKISGIDFLKENIRVCKYLAAENELAASFETRSIEEVISNLEENEFDLVLGLSVFHHLAYQHGAQYVTTLISRLAKKVKVGIFEIALAEEPLFWGPSQPKESRELLSGYSFVHEIARVKTHLSNISRPLYIASNYYWILDDSIVALKKSTQFSHGLAKGVHEGSRFYFFGRNQIAKIYLLRDGHEHLNSANLTEYNNEVKYLTKTTGLKNTPRLYVHGSNKNELWLVRGKIEGKLLSEIINEKENFNEGKVVMEVLNQLVDLEKIGYYHNDLRSWNILIDKNGQAHLIDFGSITKIKSDCAWPENIFMAFLTVLQEILTKTIVTPYPIRSPFFNPDNLGEPYKSALLEMLEAPLQEWTFEGILRKINDHKNKKNVAKKVIIRKGIVHIGKKSEEGAKIILREFQRLESTYNELEKETEGIKKRLVDAESRLTLIYSSNSWRAGQLISRWGNIIAPSQSYRRKIIRKLIKDLLRFKRGLFCLWAEFTELFLPVEILFYNFNAGRKRNINKNSQKIAYIGHSYHTKTQSTAFLIDYLREFYEVEVIEDESWKKDGTSYPDLSFLDGSYLAVIFFQNLPENPKVLEGIKNENLIFFPMYDGVSNWNYANWRSLRRFKIINFSKTLHQKLSKWGFDSSYVQYFPKPVSFIKGKKDEAFFWQRLTFININTVAALFGDKKTKLHIHKSIDPNNEFLQPTKEQEKKYQISYSDWFKERDGMWDLIKQKAIYVAPRQYEGIGLSFLEAMAMGKAVIAVDNPTMNEYITDGKTGYLFNLSHPKPIDFSNLEKVQKNTYKYIQEGYRKWETEKHKIIDFIESE